MLLSVSDMALLRALRWCQYVGISDLTRLCTDWDRNYLIAAGLIKIHEGSRALVLTGKGHAFLTDVFGNDLPQAYQTYRTEAIPRRIRLARLMLTACRAGLSVFTTQMEELSAPPAFFLPAVARGRGRNPWGNTRVAAVAALGESLYNIHYVSRPPTASSSWLTGRFGATSPSALATAWPSFRILWWIKSRPTMKLT